MDDIWGLRPGRDPAVPGAVVPVDGARRPVSPFLPSRAEHRDACGERPAGDGHRVRPPGLSLPAAMFAGIVVRAAAGARRERGVDHRTRRFDAGVLLPGVVSRVRARGYRRDRVEAAGYVWSLGLVLRRALFTKQNTITMVATLARLRLDRRAVVRIWPDGRFLRRGCPFALMTAGVSLAALLALRPGRARGRAQRADAEDSFASCSERHLAARRGSATSTARRLLPRLPLRPSSSSGLVDARRVGARTDAEAGSWRRCCISGPSGGRSACADRGGRLPFAASRVSGAVGWAIVLGIVFDRPGVGPSRAGTAGVAAGRPLVLAFLLVPLRGIVRTGGSWLRLAPRSFAMCATALTRRREACSSSVRPGGAGSGRCPLPSVRRFQRTDSDDACSSSRRGRSVAAAAPWFEETRRAIRALVDRGGANRRWRCAGIPTPARWLSGHGADKPQLPVLIRSLLDMSRRDAGEALRTDARTMRDGKRWRRRWTDRRNP